MVGVQVVELQGTLVFPKIFQISDHLRQGIEGSSDEDRLRRL
jgi:hypothetical protein